MKTPRQSLYHASTTFVKAASMVEKVTSANLTILNYASSTLEMETEKVAAIWGQTVNMCTPNFVTAIDQACAIGIAVTFSIPEVLNLKLLPRKKKL